MTEREQIAENLSAIQARITAAAKRAGRAPETIRLMAVTKKQSVETIQALIDLGVVHFGENYPDETAGKKDVFVAAQPAIQLHMIGHLQSRKIGIVSDFFDGYQSLDRVSTAEKLNAALEKNNRRMKVLMELNVGDEDSKQGWRLAGGDDLPDSLKEALAGVLQCDRLSLTGIMTLPPFAEYPEENRVYFAEMRSALEKMRSFTGLPLPDLSMGTSGDFEVAIEEGATFVRIGTALCGPR